MFYVEHMAFKLAQILILVQFFLGCQQPPRDAHLGDPIYNDFQVQKGINTSQLDAQKANLIDLRKSINESRPQSGERAILKNKISDTNAAINRLEQQSKYWDIRIAERKRILQKRALRNFFYNEEPNTEREISSYRFSKKLRTAKLQWDYKARIKASEREKSGAIAAEGAEPAPGGH